MIEACLQTLPRKLKIGPYDWSVVLIDGESDLCGQAVFSEGQLKLWPAMLTNPSHAVGTVMHECLHVIFDNQNIRKLKGKTREEETIAGFETGLISLFRDNPKLLSWMKKWLR